MSPDLYVSEHCITQYKDRFKERKTDEEIKWHIKWEIERCSFSKNRESDLIVALYNNLKWYVLKEVSGGFNVVTVYPFTQGIKHRFKYFNKIENPFKK